MEGSSTCDIVGNFWESWNAELIDNNVEDADSVLADLYSNSILLETVSCDQDLGDQRETGAFLEPCNPNGGEVQLTPLETVCFTQVSASATEKVYGPCALPVTRDSDQASVSQKNEGNTSLHKRSRCRKSQSKETDVCCPPKRSKRTKVTQKAKENSSVNSLGDNPENIVKHVVTLSSRRQFVPISPAAIPQVVPITGIANFNTAALLPPSGAYQIIQTHVLNPAKPGYRIPPAEPTYIFVAVPTTPRKQTPQIVPLSPVSGTVAPELLLISPGSSLSDSSNRTITPEPAALSSPTTAPGSVSPPEFLAMSPGSPLSERSNGTTPGVPGSPLSERSNETTPGEPVTVSSPTIEGSTCESADIATNPQPEQVEEEPVCVASYLQHVKSCMRESCGELEKDRSMESHYVDVHLLQRKVQVKSGKNANKCLEKEMVFLSEAERRKATLTRKQVFNDGQMRKKQVITLLGKPGTGKSTFIKRLCLDWAKGGLPRFRYVFSLNCKTFNLTQPDYSLRRLLFDLPTSLHCEDPEAVFKHVVSTPKEVLIIFDSFEDFKDHEGLLHSPATCAKAGGFSIKQLFSGLFLKRLLKGCTLFISTRPSGVLTPLLRKVDSILELRGFSPVEIDLYASRYFTDVPRGASALTKMKLQKYVYSLCSNPLLCRYTCFLLDYHLDNRHYALPSTLTGLALRVLSLCLKLTSQTQDQETPDISRLCTLAWDFLSTHNCLATDEQLGSTDLRDYGLATEILASHTVGSSDSTGETISYSFAHALIQNLLASLHLVLSDNVNDKALVSQTMGTSRRRRPQGEWLAMVQQFTMGLLFQNCKLQVSSILHTTTSTASTAKKKAMESHVESLKAGEMAPGKLLELCHCVYETSSKKLMKHLVKNLPDTISLCGAQLTPPDVYVFWHLLQNTKALKRQFCIDVQDTGITLCGLKELVGLDCVTSYRAPLADTIAMWEELQQSGETDLLGSAMNKLTLHPFKATQEDHINNLALLIQIHRDRNLPHRYSASLEHNIPAVRQLEKLDFELGPNTGPVIFPKLALIIPTLGSLIHLDLEKNMIGNSGAELLADVLNSLSSLKMLNLSQNSIGDRGLEKLAPALAATPSLQGLSLYNNLIGEGGAERLALVLPEMRSLIDLDVGFNNFANVGAQKLSDSLKCCPWMKSLGLWNASITYGKLQHLHQLDKRIRIQHL